MDDAIFVGEVGHRVNPVLRTKLGDNGSLELTEMLDAHEREWKKDVMETATDRFERRLTEESSRLIRWMFGFFVAQLGMMLSLAGMILHAK